LYDGDQINWVKEEMDLSNYIGQNIKIRFRLKSDGFVNEDGFYFDDLYINTLSSSTGKNYIQKSEFEKLQIYPNPAENSFKIESNNNIFNVIIYNTSGSVVFSSTKNEKSIEVNTKDWNKGIYFIRISNGSGEYQIEKLIVN
jgi:hypothetical protein